MQLLAMLDAAVQAASSGTRVEAILEVHIVFMWVFILLNVFNWEDPRVLPVFHVL